MRWLVVSGVLWASVAAADERGFQFRTVVDTGFAVRLGPMRCSDFCDGAQFWDGAPMAALGAAASWRFGLLSLHGGAELQWVWFPAITTNTLRLGPLAGVALHLARWASLSLDVKVLFRVAGDDPALAIGTNFRWGFGLTQDGRHRLALSLGVAATDGLMWTGAVSYVLSLPR